MCGIAGIIRFDGATVSSHDIQTMLDKIAHRGQDNVGIETGSKKNNDSTSLSKFSDIGLGHRRLSIIDLNNSSSQPMYYADRNLCITYNGEIYNYIDLRNLLEKKSYVFKTQSDTEVLLAAYHFWGKDCVLHLNGMFAFAIWDEKNKLLFCARDHLGIKPFYYITKNNYFAFASETSALTHLENRSLNHNSILAYFLSMYIPGNESIYNGIDKLPPGHTLSMQHDGKLTIEKYWSINAFNQVPPSEPQLEKLEQLLQESIKRQIHSDVPIGGFLSGGVDSGLITALAAPHVSTYHTYSVGYEGLIDNELPYAKKIAERYGTRHKEITISALDAMHYLDKSLKTTCEPISDPSIVATYMLSEIAAQDGVKVLLNGTGGDEIFGGYTRYSGQLSFKRKLFLTLPPLLKKGIQSLLSNSKIKARLRHPSLDMIFSTGGSYHLANHLSTDKDQFYSFLYKLGMDTTYLTKKKIPLLYKQMLFDMQVYLPNELLFLLDQMTMSHTIEGRVPLLDIHLIEESFKLISHSHINKNNTKILLKKIATPYLGIEHVNRKKLGFAGSTFWWVKQNYTRFIEAISEIRKIPHFEKLNIDAYSNINKLTVSHTNDIFMLYCFYQWHTHAVRR